MSQTTKREIKHLNLLENLNGPPALAAARGRRHHTNVMLTFPRL